ncbi:MAG: hypothetical protein KBG91_06390 [Syntrophomonadaceae bacterium]|nr:hypothetical protein [Syntrophomonadaceae bacterium]
MSALRIMVKVHLIDFVSQTSLPFLVFASNTLILLYWGHSLLSFKIH